MGWTWMDWIDYRKKKQAIFTLFLFNETSRWEFTSLNGDVEQKGEKCRCRMKLPLIIGIAWHCLNYLFKNVQLNQKFLFICYTVHWLRCKDCPFANATCLWSAVIMFIWLTDGWCASLSAIYTYWRCQTWNQYIMKSSICEGGTVLWWNPNGAILRWCQAVAGLSSSK